MGQKQSTKNKRNIFSITEAHTHAHTLWSAMSFVNAILFHHYPQPYSTIIHTDIHMYVCMYFLYTSMLMLIGVTETETRMYIVQKHLLQLRQFGSPYKIQNT